MAIAAHQGYNVMVRQLQSIRALLCAAWYRPTNAQRFPLLGKGRCLACQEYAGGRIVVPEVDVSDENLCQVGK